jgi:hypothetical protein
MPNPSPAPLFVPASAPKSTSQSISNLVTVLSNNQTSSASNNFLNKYDPASSPYLFQGNTKLENMPSSIIQQIKCKICPAPLGPEVANAQLVAVNDTIQTQANAIEQLEQQVTDLEKRYKIRFTVNNVTTNPNAKPSVTVSGDISNVLLNFSLQSPPQGPTGEIGPNGSNGLVGKQGSIGNPGMTGYWGNIE